MQAALARAQLPLDALSVLVVDAQGGAAPRLAHRARVAMNPASVMKLVTTFAALDVLGPAYTWSTPAFLDGTVQDGPLRGNLYLPGQGAPALLLASPWLLLRLGQNGRGAWSMRVAGLALMLTSAWGLYMGLVHDQAPWCVVPSTH